MNLHIILPLEPSRYRDTSPFGLEYIYIKRYINLYIEKYTSKSKNNTGTNFTSE